MESTQTESALPVLSMKGVQKRFSGVHALKGVDIAVMPGEIVALIGENGAGKSTLMKVLGGVHQPDGGTIEVGGKPVAIRGVKDAIAAGIGFIHQELNVLDNIDVAGNVFLGREPLIGGPLKLIDSKRMHRETQPYLERLGLAIDSHTPLSRLSLAQRQMVEIAKALSLDAKILIMDEPTSSLTLTETARLIEVAKDLRSHGVSIIYISHRLGEVRELADRVVGLRDGANAGGLAKDEIAHDAMVRLMVGRDIAREKPAEAVEGRAVRLAVNGLRTTRYPKQTVSFDVHAGEILGFAGLVGAGRSEVAQTIFGVDRMLGGTLALDGRSFTVRSAADAIARGIYLAPEDRKRSGLIIEMAIGQNITLPAMLRYSSGGLIRAGAERSAAEKASKALNVKTPSIDFLARNLSGGNQQKVVLAKWLSLSPKVLIFDEPTRGIDVGAKAEIYELMRSLAKEGVAIVMISSDMEEVLGLSDRVAVMHEGRITGILPGADANEESVMQLAVGAGTAAH